MATDWSHFYFPGRLYFERNSLQRLGEMVKHIGSRALILTIQKDNTNASSVDSIKNSLDKNISGSIVYDDLEKRPGFSELDTAAHFLKQSNADVIVAVGSRDTFHVARAISILSTNEVFSADLPTASKSLKKNPIPIVNVPLLPSMGEESSSSFIIYNQIDRTLFQMSDVRLFPSLIFVDPALSSTAPETDMGKYSLSTMASSIESILTKGSNEITSTIALRALSLVASNVMIYSRDHGNSTARNNMSMASLLTGMAHSSSGLGICYALASAVSVLTDLDFFLAMGILLPHVMDFNLTVSAARYIQIARALDEDITDITVIEAAIKAVEGVRKIYNELNLPQRLSDFEIRKNDLGAIANLAVNLKDVQNSMRGVDRNELETILISAY